MRPGPVRHTSDPGPQGGARTLDLRAPLAAACIPHHHFPVCLETHMESGIGFRKLRKVSGSWLTCGSATKARRDGKPSLDPCGEYVAGDYGDINM